MYVAFADAAEGAVLEVMAGSGRIAVPLAESGHDVVAVDVDGAMLARASARWEAAKRAGTGSLELAEGDITTVALERRFDLVIVALNGLLLLESRDAQHAALRTVARHVARDARAVVDTWLPAPDDLDVYDGRVVLEWTHRDVQSGEWVSKMTSARYEPAARVARLTTMFDAWTDDAATTRTTREDTIRFLSADELLEMAISAGLKVETLAGDYGMTQFAADSDRLVMVCRGPAD